MLAGTELYLLHAVHQLHYRTLVGTLLGETLVVQFGALLHEEPDVCDVQGASSHENKEYHAAVHQQHNAEDDNIEYGKDDAEAASRQEILYAFVVVDALQDVSCHFAVEVGDGHLHQFDKEVRYEGDVDACAQMQQYPTPYKIYGAAAERQHQLGNQYQIDKTEILVIDTKVYYRLCEER